MRRPMVTHPERLLEGKWQSSIVPQLSCAQVVRHIAEFSGFEHSSAVLQLTPVLQAQPNEELQTAAVIHWCGASWLRSGSRVMTLEPGLQDILLRSSCAENLDYLPPLPWPCFFLCMEESGLRIWNDLSGFHRLEGIYVCADKIKLPDVKLLQPCITVLACAEDKGPVLSDALGYFFLVQSMPIWLPRHSGQPDDMKKVMHLVAVLLKMMAAGNDAVEREVVPALTEKGQLKKAERKKMTPKSYQVIHLTRRVRKAAAAAAQGENTYTAWRLMRGHDHLYWYKAPPQDRPVVREKEGPRPYGAVRYVFPFEARRGWADEPRVRKVRIKE